MVGCHRAGLIASRYYGFRNSCCLLYCCLAYSSHGICLHPDVHTYALRVYAYFLWLKWFHSCQTQMGCSYTDTLSEISHVNISIPISFITFPLKKSPSPSSTCCPIIPCCQYQIPLWMFLNPLWDIHFWLSFYPKTLQSPLKLSYQFLKHINT